MTVTTQAKEKSNLSLDKSMVTLPANDDSFTITRKNTRTRKGSSRSMKVHSPRKRVQWVGDREDVEHEREEMIDR